MIEQLFGSKTRVKLLRLFYSNPNRSFYVREITRKVDEQINSVRRELANLLSIGIISSDNTNNRLYYEVNQEFEYFKPLLEMFGSSDLLMDEDDVIISKSKQVDPVVTELLALGNVELAFYTGQFTRDDSSGVDLVIVGDLNQAKVQKYIKDLEVKEKKDIRYVIMSPGDFEYRQNVKDRFISTVMLAKKQVLIDKKQIIEGN